MSLKLRKIHSGIQEFSSGEGVVSGPSHKNTLTTLFALTCCLFYFTEGVSVTSIVFKVPEEVEIFPGGGGRPTFTSGGPVAYSL